MANWDVFDTNNNDKIDSEFENIQSLFLSGTIKRMYQLLDRSPTKIAKLLGLNYNSYHDKLRNPEKFTTLQINTIAYAVKIDPNIIYDVIQKESIKKVQEKFKKLNSFKQKNNDNAL